MKITAVRATPVLIPLEAPYLWSYGALDAFTKCIVEVETSDGVIGIAEAPSHGAAAIIARMAEVLLGCDPLDIAGQERRVLPSMPANHSITDYATRSVWGGIEIALWDLRGKLWGQPVANLLGGIHRDRIPFTDYFSYRLPQDGMGGEASVQDVVAYCLGLKRDHGTTYFEGKVSDPDLRQNIVQALRDALGPDVMLRIDSNLAFSLPSCLYLAPAFAGLETAAYLHACAAHPHIREPNQSRLRQQPHDVIAEGPFSPNDNHIALPKGPGLGVTLDHDRIAFCARLLQDRGVPNKYHDPIAPGRMRRMPLV